MRPARECGPGGLHCSIDILRRRHGYRSDCLLSRRVQHRQLLARPRSDVFAIHKHQGHSAILLELAQPVRPYLPYVSRRLWYSCAAAMIRSRSPSSMGRLTTAGTPAASTPGGIWPPSRSTLPAASTLPVPTRLWFSTTLPIPIRVLSSITQPSRMARCPMVTLHPMIVGSPSAV